MTEPVAARARLEEAMVDTCRVDVPAASSSSTLDENTGVVTAAAADTVYEGPCMVSARRSVARRTDRGGEVENAVRYQVSIPYDADPIPVGATVVVLTSESDPLLADARLVVRQALLGTFTARRRLDCDLLEVAPR